MKGGELMHPHEWLLLAVECAVIIVSLLHIYLEVGKRKEKQVVRVIFWRFDQNFGVEKEKQSKK